jgi:hypothetical protein
MPQPVSQWKEIDVDFRRDAIFARPVLATYIGAISMHWNEIESRMAVFLAALMGAEAKTVIQVYLALQSDGGKRATIDTVTALKLQPDDLIRFQEIQKVLSARYSERNKAIHGAWGISSAYPSDLLWYDPRTTVALFPELMARLDPSLKAERRALMKEQQKNLLVYTEADFKDIIDRMERGYSELEAFTGRFVGPLFAKMHV